MGSGGGDETFVQPSIGVRAIRSGQSPLSRPPPRQSFVLSSHAQFSAYSFRKRENGKQSRAEEGAGDAMGHGGVEMRKEGAAARGRLSIAFIPD